MRLIALAVVAAVLIEGYLSASLNGPIEDSKKLVKRQAPSLPNFMPPQMGGFRPNMGPPNMGPPNMGGMRPPFMPPNMFRPPNATSADAQSSGDGQGYGYSFGTDQDGNQVSSWVFSPNGNRTQAHKNDSAPYYY